MSWEDCIFAHTADNRFKNTACNRWNGIKDDETRTFASKGAKPRGIIKEEAGGAGFGCGKRPYFYDDYQTMIKATSDKMAFDRMAARGYFPGRALLERPFASKGYQDMKYQKPISELAATTPVKEDYPIPEFDIPTIDGISMEIPMHIYGKICMSSVSRVKLCAKNDIHCEGIEIYDGITHKYCRVALAHGNIVSIYLYNTTQAKQSGDGKHIFLFVFDSDDNEWRRPTVVEAGPGADSIIINPGGLIWLRAACWASYFDNTYWYPSYACGYGTNGEWNASTGQWDATYAYGAWRVCLHELGTWCEGYRPIYMAVTTSEPHVSRFSVVNTYGDNLYSPFGGYDSATPFELKWSLYPGYDISYMYMSNSDFFSITNIQFSNII